VGVDQAGQDRLVGDVNHLGCGRDVNSISWAYLIDFALVDDDDGVGYRPGAGPIDQPAARQDNGSSFSVGHGFLLLVSPSEWARVLKLPLFALMNRLPQVAGSLRVDSDPV